MEKLQILLIAYLLGYSFLNFNYYKMAPAKTGDNVGFAERNTAPPKEETAQADTIPAKAPSKAEGGVPENIPEDWLRPLEDPSDSIYPREYADPWGKVFYRKMWKGVYAYSKSYSGVAWDDVISRIDFFDTLGRKINEFDVLAHNPYNKRTVPDLEDENYQEYVYRTFIPKSWSEGKPGYRPTSHYTYTQIPSSHSMPVIGYHLLGGIEGGVIDWKFTAICLDEKGNILRRFENLDIDPYEFCVSENKEFFCVAYGGLRGEELTRLRNNGFRIYEIETGKLVYEMEVDGKHRIAGPAADDSYENIPFGSVGIQGNDFADRDDRSKIYIRIDFNNRILYKRKLSQQEREALKGGYDKEGFIMEDPVTKKRWKLLYQKDFETEKF